MEEPGTLYKLIILYMLKKVNFPLSDPQLWSFFEQNGYTNFLNFRATLTELIEANLLTSEPVRTGTIYELTREGEDALYYFGKDIPSAVKTDMENYIRENRFQLRNETGVTSDYFKTENFDYNVHLKVREGKNTLYELNIIVADEKQAKEMCDHFEANAQNIYSYIFKQLM